MRENKVKRALGEGGVALGTMVFEFNTTGIARIAAAAGADFLVFDMEHTGWSLDTVRMLMATSRSADLVPIVRVPATEYHFLARALDLGAMGLMIPMVETEEQAKRIVQFAKYPPVGRRGASFVVAHDDYAEGDITGKMQSANEEQLLIVQIETAQGVDYADKIAALPEIDVLWVGQFDLTNSLGIPGQFTHPAYAAAVDRVLEATRAHNKTAGFMASSVEQSCALLTQGFRCLAFWGDLWIYQQALRHGISSIRAAWNR